MVPRSGQKRKWVIFLSGGGSNETQPWLIPEHRMGWTEHGESQFLRFQNSFPEFSQFYPIPFVLFPWLRWFSLDPSFVDQGEFDFMMVICCLVLWWGKTPIADWSQFFLRDLIGTHLGFWEEMLPLGRWRHIARRWTPENKACGSIFQYFVQEIRKMHVNGNIMCGLKSVCLICLLLSAMTKVSA